MRRRRTVGGAGLLVLLVWAAPAPAEDQGGFGINEAIRAGEAQRAAQGHPAAVGPLPARPEYAALPAYTGTLGDQSIRLRLGPKPDERDSVHGEYILGTAPGVRLLAGEYEGDTFLMEESDDGTRVSGDWEGTIDATGTVRGTWSDPYDPSVSLPFVIRPLGKRVIPPPAPESSQSAASGR